VLSVLDYRTIVLESITYKETGNNNRQEHVGRTTEPNEHERGKGSSPRPTRERITGSVMYLRAVLYTRASGGFGKKYTARPSRWSVFVRRFSVLSRFVRP